MNYGAGHCSSGYTWIFDTTGKHPINTLSGTENVTLQFLRSRKPSVLPFTSSSMVWVSFWCSASYADCYTELCF